MATMMENVNLPSAQPQTPGKPASPVSSPESRKRRRVIPVEKSAPFLEGETAEERRQLQVALRISVTQTKIEPTKTVAAPTYHPTLEEFTDPLAFIRKIQPEAETYGICKIVPPAGWKAPCGLRPTSLQFETKLQRLHHLQEGKIFGDGKRYNFVEYKKMADNFARERYPHLVIKPSDPPTVKREKQAAIEEEYWKIVQQAQEVEVEYANDLNTDSFGSGFRRMPDSSRFVPGGLPSSVKPEFNDKEYYTRAGWNLNNLPFLEGSVLRFTKQKIEGITVPWLYCGMLFATFAWHNEDNYLYSMNYMHYGSSKTWYGVPGRQAGLFEKTMRDHLDQCFRENPTLLYDITTVLPPSVFMNEGVSVCSVVQEPGDFIVTFPKSYHAGFSHGFNVAEAVNFALPEWIPHGRESIEHYKRRGRWTVLCHEQLILDAAKGADTLSTCLLCRKELAKIIATERADVAYLESIGIKNHYNIGEAPEDTPECVACKRACAFRGVVKCSDDEMVVCPQHVNALGERDLGQVWVLYWYSLENLEADLAELDRKIEAFEQSQACRSVKLEKKE